MGLDGCIFVHVYNTSSACEVATLWRYINTFIIIIIIIYFNFKPTSTKPQAEKLG